MLSLLHIIDLVVAEGYCSTVAGMAYL